MTLHARRSEGHRALRRHGTFEVGMGGYNWVPKGGSCLSNTKDESAYHFDKEIRKEMPQ